MTSFIRCLPFLLLLLPSACATVHFAGNGGPPENRSLESARADAACSERIWQALGSPPNIRVECRDSTITLRGIVATTPGRKSLVEFVQRQPGVNTVVDRLVVR